MQRNKVAVHEVFKAMDADGSGHVCKKEFFDAMPLLGLDVTRYESDQLFEEFDHDGGGSIDLGELDKFLSDKNTKNTYQNHQLSDVFQHVAELERKHPIRVLGHAEHARGRLPIDCWRRRQHLVIPCGNWYRTRLRLFLV